MRKSPLLLVLAIAGCGSAPAVTVTAGPPASTIAPARTVPPRTAVSTTEALLADKGKTEDQLVTAGFTKDQANCITDDVWDKIPSSDRDKLTSADAQLTKEQQTIFFTATVKCARGMVVEQITLGLTSSNSSITAAQANCISGKLTDADLVNIMDGKADALTAAVTSCVKSG